MPYTKRIQFLEESLRMIEKRTQEGDKSFVDDKIKYQTELSRMRKLQWEHDHESVHFDDRDY